MEMMKILEVMTIALLATGCVGTASESRPSERNQHATESWFVAQRNSRPASYQRVVTRRVRQKGQDAYHTVTDAFWPRKDGAGFVHGQRSEEWTTLEGSLIAFRGAGTRIDVDDGKIVVSVSQGKAKPLQTHLEIPEGDPVYPSLDSFLRSRRFRNTPFRSDLKHEFLLVTHTGNRIRAGVKPVTGHLGKCTLKAIDEDAFVGIGAFEFKTPNGIHVGVTRDFDIVRITYSRSWSVFATSKPDVELEGQISPARVKGSVKEQGKTPEKSNKPDAADGK